MDSSTPLEAGNGEHLDPVIGSNIFWVLLVLCITSAWHPLGSSVGFPDQIRRHVRIFPLTALYDTILLYAEFVIELSNKRPISVRDAARTVAIKRLRAAVPDGHEQASSSDSHTNPGPEDPRTRGRAQLTNKVWLKTTILFIGLDIRARLLSDALAVLAYAKMYGYYGTPVSFAIGTVYFTSWFANETFIFLAYGIFWADNARELVDMVDSVTTSTYPPTFSEVGMVNRALFLAQTVASIVAGVWIVTTQQRPATSGQPISLSGVLWAILRFHGKIINWLGAPAESWHQKMGEIIDKYSAMGGMLQLLLLSPFLMLLFWMAFIFLVVATPMLIMGFLLILSPLLYPSLIFQLVKALCMVVYDLLAGGWRTVPILFWARAGCLFMLISMVVYYEVLWDSAGTMKADWTEHLG